MIGPVYDTVPFPMFTYPVNVAVEETLPRPDATGHELRTEERILFWEICRFDEVAVEDQDVVTADKAAFHLVEDVLVGSLVEGVAVYVLVTSSHGVFPLADLAHDIVIGHKQVTGLAITLNGTEHLLFEDV